MTREDIFKLLNKHQDNDTLDIKTAKEMVNIIFDEHEAQLKAKESDLERQDMIIKCLNIDLDNKEKLLKEKDEDLELAMDELKIERGIKEYLANY